MDAFEPWLSVPSAELAPLTLPAWARACGEALAAGARMLTLFGRADGGDRVLTTAVLQVGAGPLHLLRGLGRRDDALMAYTQAEKGARLFLEPLKKIAALRGRTGTPLCCA